MAWRCKGCAVQEFDVWFEIPAAAEPVELVLHAHEGQPAPPWRWLRDTRPIALR